MLYQLHFRLSRDIKQNNMPFGNVDIIFCGDLLQIKPPSGGHVFAPPSNEKFLLEWSTSPLWEQFDPVVLKTNHRHGNDKKYSDICNRARIGKLEDNDIIHLNTRVFSQDSSDLPKDYLFASGTNKIVNDHNVKMLNKLQGDLYTFKAKVYTSTKRNIVSPQLDGSGMIKNSSVPFELQLKIGARVA